MAEEKNTSVGVAVEAPKTKTLSARAKDAVKKVVKGKADAEQYVQDKHDAYFEKAAEANYTRRVDISLEKGNLKRLHSGAEGFESALTESLNEIEAQIKTVEDHVGKDAAAKVRKLADKAVNSTSASVDRIADLCLQLESLTSMARNSSKKAMETVLFKLKGAVRLANGQKNSVLQHKKHEKELTSKIKSLINTADRIKLANSGLKGAAYAGYAVYHVIDSIVSMLVKALKTLALLVKAAFSYVYEVVTGAKNHNSSTKAYAQFEASKADFIKTVKTAANELKATGLGVYNAAAEVATKTGTAIQETATAAKTKVVAGYNQVATKTQAAIASTGLFTKKEPTVEQLQKEQKSLLKKQEEVSEKLERVNKALEGKEVAPKDAEVKSESKKEGKTLLEAALDIHNSTLTAIFGKGK